MGVTGGAKGDGRYRGMEVQGDGGMRDEGTKGWGLQKDGRTRRGNGGIKGWGTGGWGKWKRGCKGFGYRGMGDTRVGDTVFRV